LLGEFVYILKVNFPSKLIEEAGTVPKYELLKTASSH